MKKVLTQEEKAEKKLIKRYTLCRFSKLVTFILIAAFIGCTIAFGAGMKAMNTNTNPSAIMTVLLIVGLIGFLVIPFFIFRRISLVAILMGVAIWDVGMMFQGMFIEGENYALGPALVIFGVLAVLIGEKRRNKQKGNRKLNLDDEWVEDILTNPNADKMLDALNEASYKETTYKASLYFALSIMLAAMTGIGLVLPFGLWSNKYNKSLYFQTTEWAPLPEEVSNDPKFAKLKKYKYKENKPFVNMLNGLIYVNGKPFYAAKEQSGCNYSARAELSPFFSFLYSVVALTIYEVQTKKASYATKMDRSLGELVFSSKDMAEIDAESAELFVAYSQHQSDQNRRDLLEGLKNWFEESQRANRAELARIEREQAERDRFNSAHAKETAVYTDDEGLYAEGYDAEGTKKQYKLDEYDERTGVGTYTDESGKKVKIKNTKD